MELSNLAPAERLRIAQQASDDFYNRMSSVCDVDQLSRAFELAIQRCEIAQKSLMSSDSALANILARPQDCLAALESLTHTLNELSAKLPQDFDISELEASDDFLKPLTSQVLDDSDALFECIEPYDATGSCSSLRKRLRILREKLSPEACLGIATALLNFFAALFNLKQGNTVGSDALEELRDVLLRLPPWFFRLLQSPDTQPEPFDFDTYDC